MRSYSSWIAGFSLVASGCSPEPGNGQVSDTVLPTTGESGQATGTSSSSAGDGDSTGATGNTTGDGTSGDGTSGDGDGTSGDGDGTSGDGDGTSGDGDGTSGDGTSGDGTSGDGDGTTGDGTTGDGTTGDGTTGDGDGTSGDGTTGDGTTGDGDGDGMCLMCDLSLASTASSVLSPMNGNTFLGEAYLSGQIIYALDDVGAGRAIFTADTNILYGEVTTCPLWEWLGGTPTLPVVAGFGKQVCSGLGNNLGNYPTYTHWGTAMPAQYIGDPVALKNDFDVVVFCALGPLDPAVTQTLVEYAAIHGGGLYLASEYYAWADDDDVAAINSISNQFDVDFGKEWLDWGSATGDINFTCFPMPQ